MDDVTPMRRERRSERPAIRLGIYSLILAAALGGGALVGATVGPEPADDRDDHPVTTTTALEQNHDH